jgi:transcription elongation GreA/GreB family factor
VSKAFTREDDAGLTPIGQSVPLRAPHTRMGHARLLERLAGAKEAGDLTQVRDFEGMLGAGTVPPPEDPSVASLGAEVTLRDGFGRDRVVRLVTAAEVGLVANGASPTSPIGAAVAGSRVGDVIELAAGDVTVIALVWP